MSTATETIEGLVRGEYKYGFVTDVEADAAPPGLNEDIVRLISAKKKEPAWLLDWRLKAYRAWQKMEEPHHWANFSYPPVDYQSIVYYAAPRQEKKLGSLRDLACPIDGIRYSIDHLTIDAAQRKAITVPPTTGARHTARVNATRATPNPSPARCSTASSAKAAHSASMCCASATPTTTPPASSTAGPWPNSRCACSSR